MKPVFAQLLNQEHPNTLNDLEGVFGNVLRAAIPLGGIVLFVILLLAGVNLIMAGSDPKKAEAAKNMATYAIFGIVALALSFLILVIVAKVTGVETILNFTIFLKNN